MDQEFEVQKKMKHRRNEAQRTTKQEMKIKIQMRVNRAGEEDGATKEQQEARDEMR